MKIEKKIWPKYFREVLSGKKKFELRLANFRCKPGDVLVLREWDPKKKSFTGKCIKKKVSYVLKTNDLTFWSKKDIQRYGLQVISLVD